MDSNIVKRLNRLKRLTIYGLPLTPSQHHFIPALAGEMS